MSQMFQFHTRVVSGTLGRTLLYSFLFQTQCEVFNFNILCNYNGYKAYTVLIHPHPFLVLGRFHWGTERSIYFMYLTYFKILWESGWDADQGERKFGAGPSGLNTLNADTGFGLGHLNLPHLWSPSSSDGRVESRGAPLGVLPQLLSPDAPPWGAASQPLFGLKQKSVVGRPMGASL